MSEEKGIKTLNKSELVKVMKEGFKDQDDKQPNLKLPKKLDIKVEDNICLIKLDAQSVLNENMQENVNAFEGWALAIYYSLKKRWDESIQIELDIKNYSDFPDVSPCDASQGMDTVFVGKGHFGRFLYRALRFSEQYKWFVLSNELVNYVNKFKSYLGDSQNIFINNVPNNEAGIKQDHDLENKIEAKLAEDGKLADIVRAGGLEIGKNGVFRQLPVGLFKEEVKEDSAVFTGGKSAIDLWTWNDKVFHVVELKANQKMVGIITEIFFYANYMRDLLLTDGFTINKKYHEDEKKNRGYDHIVSGKYNRINGIMLADIYHPIVCEEILELMNESELRDENGDHIIKYFRTEYEWEAVSVRRKQK